MISPLAGPGDGSSSRFRSAGEVRVRTGRQTDAEAKPEKDDPATRKAAEAKKSEEAPGAIRGADGKPLSVPEQQLVRELRAREVEVRAHEAAHQAAGGALTGGASFSYETGPDGKRYAVGGEVSVELSTGDDPQDTIARMAQVRAAALAPADPSAQDRAVAASAAAISARAQAELARLQQEQQRQEQEQPGSRFSATA